MIRLGQDWVAQTALEPLEPVAPSETEIALNRILVGLMDLKEAIAPPPAPVVTIEPTDLSDIVTAVNGLRPGATADDIATAIASKLAPPAAQPDITPVLGELVKRLETLDFRQLGMGRVGGGTVTLASGQTVPVTNTYFVNQVGTWDYRSGVSGSPSAFTGRVLGITAHCTNAGSMTINGGDSIPIPANVAYVWTPQGNLVSPTLVFTGTDTYGVEFLT